MKNYELTYIVPSELSEEEIKSLWEKIKSFLQEEAGVLEETTRPSKEKLGYLVALNFSLNPDKLSSFEKKIKSESKILRYLISTKKTKEKIQKRRILPRLREPIFAHKKIIKPKKVELEEIDKKIEEILRE